ncbi:hypothetical protein [Nocardioides lijunqiniae]|uniref:hypothetical protein n=1 Tax=Nocardioides lijunqiniae TaxID=2760832 RepID=UPI001877741F|nr:hypothetical protein [Nocardioides lijunqiniae]
MRGARLTAVLMWLPPAVTAILVWLVYRTVHDDEYSSNSSTEAVLAGLVMSTPFIFLMCLELALAALTGYADTYRERTWCLGVATVAAVLVLASVLWFLRRDLEAPVAGLLVTLTLLPLAPAWLSHARDPAAPAA